MSDRITAAELESLKSRFRAVDCTVTDLDDTSFEIVGSEFPIRTHVFVTPYYVQLGTFIDAAPQGFLPNRKGKIHAFLNTINVRAKLAKFTLETDKPDADSGGWPIFASTKFVTGVIGGDYDAAALKNLVMLWFQDVAELIASPCAFELRAMMQEGESGDA
jgi:hypothetical protein